VRDALSLGRRLLLLLLAALRLRLFLQLRDHLKFHHFLLFQEIVPLLVQLLLFCVRVQLDGLLPQLLCLLVEQDHARDVLLAAHALPLDKLLVALVIVGELVLH